jgi:hypothetical protein
MQDQSVIPLVELLCLLSSDMFVKALAISNKNLSLSSMERFWMTQLFFTILLILQDPCTYTCVEHMRHMLIFNFKNFDGSLTYRVTVFAMLQCNVNSP